MQDMAKLGRDGGVARARTLKPRRRKSVARAAAAARWKPRILELSTPTDHEELQCFVAQYGNGVARANDNELDHAAILSRALTACRDDTCLARMLPVFLWRARFKVLNDPAIYESLAPVEACTLGYFVELVSRMSRLDARDVLCVLRTRRAELREPVVLFRLMQHDFLRPRVERMTSSLAKSWNLLLGETDDSFERYFTRMVGHAAQV